MWIVGIDCRDGVEIALPVGQCMIILDMTGWKESLKQRMSSVRQAMTEADQMETIPLPAFIQQLTGIEEGPEITEEVKDQWAKNSGNELETLASMMMATMLVTFNGDNYPLRSPRCVDSWEEVLAARTAE